MDNTNPDWVWYGAGIIALVAAGVYYSLMKSSKQDMMFRLSKNNGN